MTCDACNGYGEVTVYAYWSADQTIGVLEGRVGPKIPCPIWGCIYRKKTEAAMDIPTPYDQWVVNNHAYREGNRTYREVTLLQRAFRDGYRGGHEQGCRHSGKAEMSMGEHFKFDQALQNGEMATGDLTIDPAKPGSERTVYSMAIPAPYAAEHPGQVLHTPVFTCDTHPDGCPPPEQSPPGLRMDPVPLRVTCSQHPEGCAGQTHFPGAAYNTQIVAHADGCRCAQCSQNRAGS